MNSNMQMAYYIESKNLINELKSVIAKLHGRYNLSLKRLIANYKDKNVRSELRSRLHLGDLQHISFCGSKVKTIQDALDIIEIYQYELCSIVVPKGAKVKVVIES